jgi:outer membrane protein OmpA-like peptidoglycan-associated protein
LNPYIAAGVGGNFVQYGSEASTEESNFVFSVPLGIGVNYELKDNVMLNVQGVYNRTWDDEIDNYPLDGSDAVAGVEARDDIDGVDHDDFFTLSIGAMYTFGGDDSDDMSMEERMLQQSMRNLEAAEGSSEEASSTLQQAQQLNDETLAALEELRAAMEQMPEESEDLKAEIVNVVNNVQFEFDSEEIIEPAYDELNSLAAIMQEYDALKVDIAAHADERGSASYNEDLSMRRAQAVKDYMVQQGVSASRVTTSAMGEENPLMSGNSATTYAQNRSVQVTLSYDGTKSK